MLFRILGQVAVTGDNEEVIVIAARRQRALLARLILDTNRLVNRSVLLEWLWASDLPTHPETALHVVMCRLRANLGPYGARIVAEGSGYRLDAGPDEVDLLQAERLLSDGRLALAGNEASRAAVIFERALALWTGDPLHEVPEIGSSQEAGVRLHQLRLTLVEACNDAYLNDGRHLEVLGNIEAWVAAEPLREHLRAQQIAALYRAGRQAEALRACDSLRKSLRDEAGLEPSAEIRRLERRVLDQDPSLVATDAGFMTPLPAWTAETLAYVGRDAPSQQLTDRLAEAVEGKLRFVLVEGAAGVGKSRFLLHAARRFARDAIVLPIHVHELFTPALHTLSRIIAEATAALTDDELAMVITALPDVPADIPRARRIGSALIAGEPVDGLVHDRDLLLGAALWIGALSGRAPVVLLIDDLDSVSSSIVNVIGQLASLSMPKRVLIVGSIRSPFVRISPQLAQLTATLEEQGCVDHIELEPLSKADIDAVLAGMRVNPRGQLVDRLDALTAGNSLLLAELLSMGPPERVVSEWSSPPRIRDLARQRTAELGRATAEFLKWASLFEHDFTIELLAETSQTSTGTATALVDRAVEAHVLQPSTMHSYRFSHQLFRQALVTELSDTQRADGHRRIAEALERRGTAPGLLAAHWTAASGDDVAQKVFTHARAAGHESLTMLEPSAAVNWFELALAYLTDEADRGSVLTDLAEAQQFAGDAACVENLQEAVRIALATHDDALTLQIVRVTTPGWSTLPGVTTADTSLLLARALEIVDDEPTRSRILTRLAVDLTLRDPAAAQRAFDESLTLARESGSRTALLEALSARASMSLTPHSLEARRPALREVLSLAAHATDAVTRYFALGASVVASIQAGDLAEAEAALAAAATIAAHYDLAPMQWSARARRAWTEGLHGNLERAELLIDEALEFGNAHGVTHAPELARLQRGMLRWQQNRVRELTPVAREIYRDFGPGFPGIALLLARVLAEDPDHHDEARQLLCETAQGRFATLPVGTFWSTALVVTAETAFILDRPEESAVIRDLLLPFADQVAFSGTWVAAPIAYGIGVAAAGCHDRRSSTFLKRAAKIADDLHAPVLAARARRPLKELR